MLLFASSFKLALFTLNQPGLGATIALQQICVDSSHLAARFIMWTSFLSYYSGGYGAWLAHSGSIPRSY